MWMQTRDGGVRVRLLSAPLHRQLRLSPAPLQTVNAAAGSKYRRKEERCVGRSVAGIGYVTSFSQKHGCNMNDPFYTS